MSDLRTRIAATLIDYWPAPWYDSDRQHNQVNDLADAILDELQLVQEWSAGDDDDGRVLWDNYEDARDDPWRSDPLQTRWVTGWIVNE